MSDDRLPEIDAAQEIALELLRTGRRFLLVGHVRPDGDCLGAQAALASVLRSVGKEVVIMNPDEPDARFDYMIEGAPFRTFDGRIPDHDVCVLLDINELSRCGDMSEHLAAAASKKLVIDHHPHSGEAWWDAAFVDVGASATGALVWRIGRLLGCKPDRTLAVAVYTSLVTDTGWFKYSNTDAEAMDVAARMVSLGVEPHQVYAALYQRNPPGEPHAVASLLSRLEYFGDGRLAVVDQPLARKDGPLLADGDSVLDILRSVGEVEVVLYVKELEGGVCKLSARSKDDYDVNALARKFGGGGHVKASGATIRGDLAEVRARLVEAALEGFSSRNVASDAE